MSSTIVISQATLDTNILIYSIDGREERKHQVANRVVGTCSQQGCLLPLQSLNEFYRASSRSQLMLTGEALRIIRLCRLTMRIVPPSEEDLYEAIKTHEMHRVQFYDALLIATSLRAGCRTLFSEDMQHLRNYNGLQVINPFKLSATELDEALS